MIAIACLVAFVIGAFADENTYKSKQVRFHTDPESVNVFIKGPTGKFEPIGQSDTPVVLAIPQRASEISLRFELRGYHSQELDIGAHAFDAGLDRWPEEGVISLQRESYPWWPAGLMVMVVAVAGWFGRHRSGVSPPPPSSDEQELLEGYQLLEVLGQGGMATVYRARGDSGSELALKLMRDELGQNPEYRARFEREIKVCLQMNHPGIVRIIDWSVSGDKLFLAMELVDGKTLRDHLSEGISDAQAARYLVQLLEAVDYAHQQGVVHRDLKPDNVMITKKGHLKVMDFGLARDNASATITQSGVALGTPAYMAPEQVQSAPYSPATDQYSLGMMAYELLGGKHPFGEEEGYQVIFKHVTDMPPPVREFRPELPPALDEILLRMVAKDPQERYPNLTEVREALEQAFWS